VTQVTVLSAAELDLRLAVEFYSRERQGLGTEFLREFEAVSDGLAQHPEIGSPIRKGVRKLLLKRFPYMLVYRIEPEQVLILAVAHQRHHPDIWLGRL
jgi:plasmid stabilization system protein ParE